MPDRSRAYRLLLLLFPPGARRQRGGEMERLVADMLRERRRQRRRLDPAFWSALAWDTVREAGRAWLVLLAPPFPARPDRTESLVSALLADLRYGIRQLVRHPGYGAMLIVLMSVGIAGNAAVFRVFNGLFLRPLPFAHAERLVDLDERAPEWNLEYTGVNYTDFHAWRRENRTFEAMAVFTVGGSNLVAEGAAERITMLVGTHDLDDALGLEPQLGRFFTAEEDVPDGARVAVISDPFWTDRYGRDPSVLGRVVQLNGAPFEVVGVLPPAARFLSTADVWTALQADPLDGDGWYLRGVGRLQPDVTLAAAETDLTEVHARLIPERDVNEVTSPVVSGLRDRYLGSFRTRGGFLLAAVAAVLLIACANIAGLVLARSLSRASELGIRQALGASRGRIVRQLVAENVVVATFGGAVGTAVGFFASNALVRATADRFPAWVTFDVDARWTLFLATSTTVACALFGVLPALRVPRGELSTQGRATSSRRRRRVMGALVASEVAIAVALLVVGGLTALDSWRLANADPGFEAEGVLTYRLALPSGRYPDAQSRAAFADDYAARLEAIPGVVGVGIGNTLPLFDHWGWFFVAEGAPPRAEGEATPVVLMRTVSPGYFDALGVRLLAGRFFDDRDGRTDGERVVIVNETFVRTHLGDGTDPIGRRIANGTSTPDGDTWMTIVGVTRDVKHYGVDEPMRPGVYQPLPQYPVGSLMVAVRAASDPSTVASAVRAATSETDPELPAYGLTTMTEQLRTSLWPRRAIAWLVGAFSTVALLLSVAGLYGVISYAVGQRSREISIRMAMGARAEQVRREIVRGGMGLAALGLAVGAVGAFAMSGLVAKILVGVPSTEPTVYAAVAALLALVALAANWLPARRAAALDPARALRGE